MKRICILTIIVLLVFAMPASAEDFKVQPLPKKTALAGEVEHVPGEILVKFKEGVFKQEISDLAKSLQSAVLSEHRAGVKRLRVPAGKTEQEFVSALQGDSRVEYAELNTICHAFMTPNDPYYSYQWHFPKINCSSAWDISSGSGVVVAVLDCGIAYENYPIPSYELNTVQSGVTNYMQAPDLAGTSFTAGYDFVNDDSHPNDNDGHGTHVAGTIAQTTNDGYGVAGVAFDCTLMPVKVLDYTGSGTANWLADGLYWAADHGAQVVNMSMGWPAGYNPGSTVQNAIVYAYNHGVVLVAASGNQGVGTISYPAKYSQVIAVGATRYDDALSYYSQYGAEQEVVAPGGDVTIDQNGDSYGDGILQQTMEPYDPGPPEVLANPTSFGWYFFQGTSMACPHVVGLVAMMIANGQTGIENIRNILHETAQDLGSAGWDQTYGYGLVDAYAALTYGGNPPVAGFSGSPLSGCVPLTVDFTDESTGEIDTWEWNFGDGSAHSFVQNPSHQYTSTGDFTVSLTVTNAYGSDTETKTNYITVIGPPTADFSGSPTSGEVPLTVNFTNLSTGAASYSWDFGDTGSSTQANPSHTYTETGNYTVTLTATNSCGSDVETKTNYITVTCTPPIADFSGSPTSGEVPLTVNFTDQSTGATSWSWDFGDEGTSSQQNPSHQFAEAGTYTVTLTATNSCGSDVEAKIDYITVTCTPPVAEFTGSPTSGNAPLTVDFTDLSTGAAFWSWDFGDGIGTSAAQNPTYEYTAEGTYTVTLTVTNTCGSDVETKTDYIEVTPPDEWTVITYDDFESGWGSYTDGGGDCSRYTGGTYAHQGNAAADIQDNSGVASSFYHTLGYDVSGYAELEVDFWFMAVSMDNSNEDFWLQYYDGSSWQTVETWARSIDFENNQFYHEVVPISSSQYNFPTNAKLRFMCDASGNADDVYIDEIEFRGLGGEIPPTADFVGDPTSGYYPLSVNFTDLSTNNPTSWSWDFGDGVGTSTQQNPSYTYTDAGTYTVTLTATNAYGSDEEVKVDYITAITPPPPTADFVGDPTSGYAPLTVDFTDQSTGNPTSWSWDFGDGVGTSTEQNPSYTYNDVGDYTVTLTATNAYGSDAETKTDYITVTQPGEDIMHVHSIVVTRQSFWWFARGITTVTIYDQVGAPVSDATVYGVFSGPTSESRSGNTNGNGQVQFQTGYVYNPSGEWCFELTNVTKSNWTYDPNANEVTKACESGPVYRPVASVPEKFSLSQNYPNPFNPVTRFSLDLVNQTHVSFVIYNVAGQKVRTLVDEVMPAGSHMLMWNGTNDDGETLSSGVYLYRVVAGDEVVREKMTLLK